MGLAGVVDHVDVTFSEKFVQIVAYEVGLLFIKYCEQVENLKARSRIRVQLYYFFKPRYFAKIQISAQKGSAGDLKIFKEELSLVLLASCRKIKARSLLYLFLSL